MQIALETTRGHGEVSAHSAAESHVWVYSHAAVRVCVTYSVSLLMPVSPLMVSSGVEVFGQSQHFPPNLPFCS